MKKYLVLSLLLCAATAWAADPAFQVQIHYIEACSCDLFCPCYFNDHASHHGTGAHSCTFNNVGKVTSGKYGDTNLTGLKFWLSGDRGSARQKYLRGQELLNEADGLLSDLETWLPQD